MSIKKGKLFSNILALSSIQIANYVLPLLSVPIISRIIGPEKFGIINLASSFTAYFVLLIGYGFDLTATRKIAQIPNDEERRSRIFSEVFSCKLLLFILSIIIFCICLFTVRPLEQEKMVAVFSFLFCISTLLTQNWLFQGMQNLTNVAMFSFFSKLIFTISILIVIKKQEDYVWQPLVISIAQIISALISLIWAVRKYRITFSFVSFKECVKLLYEERTVFFSLIVISFYTTTNTVILGLFQSPVQVGYYTAAQRLILISQSVIALPIAQALYPYIGSEFGKSFESGLKSVQQLVPLIIFFTGGASIIMFLLSPFIFEIFYGSSFSDAVVVFQILVIIPFVISLSNIFGMQIMLNLGMDKAFFKITFMGAVISVTLNFLMVKEWGYIGTALNWVITESFITLIMYISVRLKKINPFNLSYFKYKEIIKYYSYTKR
ncbi:oligosaccharide flippase family protein [Emticicia sediminis]